MLLLCPKSKIQDPRSKILDNISSHFSSAELVLDVHLQERIGAFLLRDYHDPNEQLEIRSNLIDIAEDD